MQNKTVNSHPLLYLIVSVFLSGLTVNSYAVASVDDLYKANCASCHGDNMQGGLGVSLIDDTWIHGGSDKQIANIISLGVSNTSMIAWKNTLSAEEIRSLVIYIRETKYQSQLDIMKQTVSINNGKISVAGQQFKLTKIDSNNGGYWGMEFLPDNSYLVTQIDGKLWHFTQGKKVEITGILNVWFHSQGGLLDIALHPNYENNKLIYLSYAQSDKGKKGMTAIVRGRIVNNHWQTEKQIFKADSEFHLSAGHHYGDRMVFKDNYLYFSIGDRGSKEMAQDISKPNGKIHRLTLDGNIPSDNPFIKHQGAFKSIWSFGHRNPQGMTLNTTTKEIWAVEHGPRGGDETNLIVKANNYGWPLVTFGMNYNGTPMTDKTSMPGMTEPKWHWTPSIAVSSIEFYHGKSFPSWNGKALIGSLAKEELRLLSIVDNKVINDQLLMKGHGRIRDLKVAPDGSIYLLLNSGDRSNRQGSIYQITNN